MPKGKTMHFDVQKLQEGDLDPCTIIDRVIGGILGCLIGMFGTEHVREHLERIVKSDLVWQTMGTIRGEFTIPIKEEESKLKN